MTVTMEADHIDRLLERYLLLLDEYTTLRSSLSSLQGAMYQNIARANFSAERGIRYGQDFYDDRMQASRKVKVEVLGGNSESVPAFSVVDQSTLIPEQGNTAEKEEHGEKAVLVGDTPEQQNEGKQDEKSKKEANRNPLRWFGLVTPMPLRLAQDQAVQIIENVVPRLATVNAEMLNIEIEVRRARKKRAKAEIEAAKRNAEASQSSSVRVEAA